MNIIPAIDISDGKVIRLKKGKTSDKTVYYDNPELVMKSFMEAGAAWVHIVDIDRATGSSNNKELIKKLLSIKGIKKEIGGGLRKKDEIIRMLEYGADRVVIGTAAYKNEKMIKSVAVEHPDKIVVALDFSKGNVMVNGWLRSTGAAPVSFAKRFMPEVKLFLITDISRDGMLAGIDEKFYYQFATETGSKVIVSGGVKSLDDIKKALRIGNFVEGIIIGKALYEKRIDLKKALEAAVGTL